MARTLPPDEREHRCPSGRLCPTCYADTQRAQDQLRLQDWLRTFGTEPDPRAPRRHPAGLVKLGEYVASRRP